MFYKSLERFYRQFSYERVVNAYLKDKNEYVVLAENFVENLYFFIYELDTKHKYFLIIENIKNPIIKELKTLKNKDGYIVVSKKDFSQKISLKIRKKLAKRGICFTVENGLKCNKYFCLHRLVACLYFDCIGLEVHHINKNTLCNSILNLVPLTPDFHKLVDNDLKNGENFAKDVQNHLFSKKKKRNQTVANSDNVICEILKYKTCGFPTPKIIDKIQKYAKKSKIYEILNFYYYLEDFIKWLKIQHNQCFSEFYGKSKNGLFANSA